MASSPAEPPAPRAGPTIRLEARLSAPGGSGRAARAWAATLAETGLAHRAVELDDAGDDRADTVVLRQIGAKMPAADRPAGRLTIGLWDPLIDEPVPEGWRHAPPADEIWVPGREVALAAAPTLTVPVVAMLPAAIPPTTSSPRPALAIPADALLFAAAGAGVGSGLQAFVAAFPAPAAGAALALAAADPGRVAALVAGRPDIVVLPGVGDDVLRQLVAAADVFVALDDAAGFGWPVATAVAAGRPVVASADFGARDYLAEAALPIPLAAGPAAGRRGRAGADLAQAAVVLRRLVHDPSLVAAASAAAARAGRRLAPAAAARRVVRRLAALRLAARRQAGRVGWTRSPDGNIAAAVFGHHSDPIGYGIAARGTAAALHAAGVPTTTVDIPFGPTTAIVTPPAQTAALLQIGPGDLVANTLAGTPVAGVAAARTARGPVIGLWAWEGATELPELWHKAVDLVDEVWVPSRFVAQVAAPRLPVPVIVMPHALPRAAPAGGRPNFSIPDEDFVFLFAFDGQSLPARKNPEGVVAAYRRAFPAPRPATRLIIKAKGMTRQDFADLRAIADGRPDIQFIHRAFDGPHLMGLMAACDCYVSLHRAEGFGLTIAEAMAQGKPVIATGYSGNLDFMSADTGHLVRFRLVATDREHGRFPAGTIWAEPDLDHAAELMRRVRDDPAATRALGRRAAAHIGRLLSPASIGRRMAARLRMLDGAGDPPRPAPSVVRREDPVVLVATPVKDAAVHVDRYLTLLDRIDHDPARLSVAFLESDSADATHAQLESQLPRLAARYRRVLLHRRHYGLRIEGRRSAPAVQARRRAVLAQSRNELLARSLTDETWVLWLDVDLLDYPPDLLRRLLATGRDVVVPRCIRPDGRPFDLNTFRFDPARGPAEHPSYLLDGLWQPPPGAGRCYLDGLDGEEAVPVDSVGGTALLVRAELHRAGLIFPAESYRGYVETEGLAMMARDMGHRPWAVPGLRIVHAWD